MIQIRVSGNVIMSECVMTSGGQIEKYAVRDISMIRKEIGTPWIFCSISIQNDSTRASD